MNQIITFYSYKGGVGRSMALANVAVVLSHFGFRVLIIDWDLEAPGIENFFKDYIPLEQIEKREGIINLILNQFENKKSKKWQELINSFKTEISTEEIHLITAGKKDQEYYTLLKKLNIGEFYLNNDGGNIIENLRNEWKEAYDFVLIDSRTGVTDIGGVCTIQLPDILVLFFSPTKQGLYGTKQIAARAANGQKRLPFDREKLLTIPIPTRIDYQTEFQITKTWIERIAGAFDQQFDNWLPTNTNKQEFIEKIKIPYISYFSYGEELAVISQGMNDPSGLGYAYENLSALIANSFEYINDFSDFRSDFIQKTKEIVLEKKLNHVINNSKNTLDLRFLNLNFIPIRVREMEGLTHLILSNNHIKVIPDWLQELSALKVLDLSNNEFENIPEWLFDINNITNIEINPRVNKYINGTIYLADNPIKSIPIEILKEGFKATKSYFAALNENKKSIVYEAKVLILGEGGSGKTSLARRLVDEKAEMPTEKDITKGIDVFHYDFLTKEGNNFRIHIWDFGGQEIYHSTHQFFLTKRSLYLLLDDTRRDDTTVNDTSFNYWLQVVELLSENSPVLIIQNEKSDRSKALDLKSMQGRFDQVKGSWATNIKTGRGLKEIRTAIEFYVQQLPQVGIELPTQWIQIRNVLEKLANRQDYISLDEYFKICSDHQIPEEDRALNLSSYLHDLGTFLHFQQDFTLANLFILRNTWATDAVYKVLDDEHIKAQLGYFTQSDLESIWSGPRYKTKRPQLLALMQKFQLCFQLKDRQEPTWLAPQLLPIETPEYDWDISDNLLMRYTYDFMPKGLLSRFFVRMNHYVLEPGKAWRSGVFLHRDRTDAFVLETYHSQEIIIKVTGLHPKELMTLIGEEFDQLNESYGEKLRVSKMIPCICATCATAEKPHFYDYANLKRRKEKGKMTTECEISFEDVSVRGLLDGVFTKVAKTAQDLDIESKQTAKTIQLFLASSAELAPDRKEIEIWIGRENKRLRAKGIFLNLNIWEHTLDVMNPLRKQDDYNQLVQQSDIFINLFATKVGKYSEEEFKMAWEQFSQKGKPKYLYTYFKNQQIAMSDINDDYAGLTKFKTYLKEELRHFPSDYATTEDLLLQLKTQLDKILVEMGG